MGPEQQHGGELEAEFTNPVEEFQSNQQQQDKIIKYFETGRPEVVEQNEVYVSPTERSAFLGKIKTGELGDHQFSELLDNIAGPVDDEDDLDNPVGLWQRVQFDHEQRGILAQFAKGDSERRDELTARDLGEFLHRYAEPISFEQHAKGFLAEHPEYDQSFKELERSLFGKQQEYWEQIQDLVRQAESLPEPAQAGELSLEQIQRIMQKAEVHGGEFKGKQLTPEILKSAGLEPKYRVPIEGINFNFSNIFEYRGDRKGVIGYIETPDGKVVARSYYLSQSQGTWRYLPGYKSTTLWHDKGHGEDGLNLPIEAQKYLGQTLMHGYEQRSEEAEFYFYGTARNLEQARQGTYYFETARDPIRLEGRLYAKDIRSKLPPESLAVSDQEAPNFTEPLDSWRAYSPVYSQIQFEAFASNDGRFKYLFATDSTQRSWLASIENGSKLISSGIHEKWVYGGNLVTPLYEYDTLSSGYGGAYQRGSYVEMWTNYLSKVPLIQRYQSERGIR